MNLSTNTAAILSQPAAAAVAAAMLIEPNMEQQILGMQPNQAIPNRYMNQRDKVFMYQLNQYYLSKSTARKGEIAKTIQEVIKIVQDVLRELEIQEPRFISTFTEINGHFEGSYHIYRPPLRSIAFSMCDCSNENSILIPRSLLQH